MPAPPIAVMSHTDVSQPDCPRSRRVTALIQALGRHVLLFQPGPRHPFCETRELPWNLARFRPGSDLARWNFRIPANRRRVRNLLEAIQPGLVILTSIWDYPAVEHLKGVPLALDAESVEAVTAEKRHGARSFRARRIAERERQVLRRVDHIFAASEADLRVFQDRYGVAETRLSLVPNGVDVEELVGDPPIIPMPARVESRLEGKVVMCLGAPAREPLWEEALVFCNQVLLPELDKLHPGLFALLVAGTPPPKTTLHPSLVFGGKDADARACLARAQLVLFPVRAETGAREDILVALASGKPVVSTPAGMEGLPCANGVHAVIEETAGFAREIHRLAGDAGSAESLGRAARPFVRAMLDWRSLHARWQVEVNRLLQPPAPT